MGQDTGSLCVQLTFPCLRRTGPLISHSVGKYWADQLDQVGVTIVHSAGNRAVNLTTGKSGHFMGDMLPHAATTEQSPIIAVGNVYRNGSLYPTSGRSGSAFPGVNSDAAVTLYAVGVDIRCIGVARSSYWKAKGTSFAAPHVVSRSTYHIWWPYR